MGDEGSEQPAQNTGETQKTGEGDAESGAQPTESATVDPDLLWLIAAWDDLPAAVRRGIAAMVEASKQDKP